MSRAASQQTLEAAIPDLFFFHSSRSGLSRRVDGYLAQVLQRRQNHDTFNLYRVASEERADLVERFGIEKLPAIVVIEDGAVTASSDKLRTVRDIETLLAPWLR